MYCGRIRSGIESPQYSVLYVVAHRNHWIDTLMSRRFALLIGNNAYEDTMDFPPLVAPSADVESLKKVLLDRNIGAFDEVQSLIDISNGEIRREMELFW